MLKSKRGWDEGEAGEAVLGGGGSQINLLPGVPHHALAPIHIKLAAALAALVRLFTHGIINGHSQQFTAVRTLHFRGTCDCSREAKFVVDEVVKKGH